MGNDKHIPKVEKLFVKDLLLYTGEHDIDLDADLILIMGKNGVGKSTLIYALDAILNRIPNFSLDKLNATYDKTELMIKLNEDDRLCFKKNSKDYVKSYGHKNSGLFSQASTYYMEQMIDFELDDLTSFLSFSQLPNIKKMLDDPKNQWLPDLEEKHIKVQPNIAKERKPYTDKFIEIVNSLEEKELIKSAQLLSKQTAADISNDIQIAIKSVSTLLKDQEEKYRSRFLGLKNIETLCSLIKNVINILSDNAPRGIYVIENVNSKEEEKTRINSNAKIMLIATANSQMFYIENLIKHYKNELQNNQLKQQKLKDLRDATSLPGYPALEEVLDALGQYGTTMVDIGELPSQIMSFFKHYKQNYNDLYDILNMWKTSTDQILNEYKLAELEIRGQLACLNDSKNISNILQKVLSIDPRVDIPKGEHDINKFIELLSGYLDENNKDMIDSVSEGIPKLRHLLEHLKQWSICEQSLLMKINEKHNEGNKTNHALRIIESTKTVLRTETGTNSILGSFYNNIPNEQWVDFFKNIDSLLKAFHFPVDFLPLQLQPKPGSRGKNKKYIITTNSEQNIAYENLSLGQKTQLNICFMIALNFALGDFMPHKMMLFDDFTTCLDMAQIVPAALILRKLAYTRDPKSKRQIVITSHHEGITNNLIAHLRPPNGNKMLVIYIEDWSIKEGPKIKYYDVCSGNVELDKALERLEPFGIRAI